LASFCDHDQRKDFAMAKPETKSNTAKEQQDFTARLRDKIVQQVAESAQVQTDLRTWYAKKLGKEVAGLNLDECPALLRVMQIIRLLRESQLELEQAMEEPQPGV
jgi:hypothetical protein